MTITVTSTVQWVSQCYDHGIKHEHVSLYRLQEGNDVILVDSDSVYHREEIAIAIADTTNGMNLMQLSYHTPIIRTQ